MRPCAAPTPPLRPVCAPAIVCVGVTTFDQHLLDARPAVIARLSRMVGDAASDASADGRDVRDALGALTPHQRLVLLLRFEQGLSLRELGALLDVGEDAARKRVARAREAFAAALHDVRA